MKIIHTSDWHIGKQLNGFSRIEEQKKFLDEFIEIVKSEKIDIVLIAGDIYDVTTPSIEAEQLFYNSMEAIARNGETIVIVSAGNHDSADRLMASRVWGSKLGIVIVSTINDEAIEREIGNFKINSIEKGVFRVYKKTNEKTEEVVFLNLGYPSETRVGHKIEVNEEKSYSELYSEYLEDLIAEKSGHFTKESYNILIGHFLMLGGKISDTEKELNIGGLDYINSKILSKSIDYVALGHLHSKQKISGHKNCYYSGAPMQYSKKEKGSLKYIGIIDTNTCEEPVFKELKIHKPIEVLRVSDVDETIEYIKSQEDEKWYYIEIEQSAIETSKIQALRSSSNSIVEIIPINKDNVQKDENSSIDIREKTMRENFIDYYKYEKGDEPSQELIKMFLEIVGE